MPIKSKTRHHREWKRLRNANLRDYEDEFEPRMIKRIRGGFMKAKERFPIIRRKR